MPHEIADSDAESDLDSPRRPSASPIPENNNISAPSQNTLNQDPFANLEFDQFLSPTQRLSSALEQHDTDHFHSISSTDRFLRDLAQQESGSLESATHIHGLDGSMEQSVNNAPRSKPKRTLSDIEGGRPENKLSNDALHQSVKRSKTYGSSRSYMSDASSLFSSTPDLYREQEFDPARSKTSTYSLTTSTELPVQQLVHPESNTPAVIDQHILHGDRNHGYTQAGMRSFSQSNIQNAFVTKSSMGGYEGINLDFRGAGLSLDTTTNPFGSLSQVSLDCDMDQLQNAKFARLFQHSQQSTGAVPAATEPGVPEFLRPSHLKEMATSPIQGLLTSRQEELPENIGSSNCIRDKNLLSVPDEIPEDDTGLNDAGAHAIVKAIPKKRGRKPKAAPVNIDIVNPQSNDLRQPETGDQSDLHAELHKASTRSRAGTVDSVGSNLSNASKIETISTHKRKKPSVSDLIEKPKGQKSSSEPNLSDLAMIREPNELYVPKASKSRSRRVHNDEEDELRKDETTTQSEVGFPPAEDENSAHTIEPVPSPKKKPGRKSKVKRAKTSAAALLKAAVMYDEEDKDCVIVDVLPAKVKMAPLPDLSPVKQETQEGMRNELDHRTEDEHERLNSARAKVKPSNDLLAEAKISIDIPQLPRQDEVETPAPKPEPKKRGRKPKKKPEIQITDKPDMEEVDQANINTEQTTPDPRPVLAEKDPNITSPSKPLADYPQDSNAKKQPQATTPPLNHPQPLSQTPSPKKQAPVHSPLKTSLSSTATSSSSSKPSHFWTKPRVGLSKRTSIPSLLRKLDRTREPPKLHERKEKLSKRQQEEEDKRRLEAEDRGEEYVDKWELRGKDGMLLEWDE